MHTHIITMIHWGLDDSYPIRLLKERLLGNTHTHTLSLTHSHTHTHTQLAGTEALVHLLRWGFAFCSWQVDRQIAQAAAGDRGSGWGERRCSESASSVWFSLWNSSHITPHFQRQGWWVRTSKDALFRRPEGLAAMAGLFPPWGQGGLGGQCPPPSFALGQ